jgi:PAS domain S-box-containing protein
MIQPWNFIPRRPGRLDSTRTPKNKNPTQKPNAMPKKKTDLNTLRKRAEAYLADAGYKEKDFSGLDMQELLHELHIHHAELDVQNEELKNALDELEAERNRYLDLFESAPVGYAVLDDGGIVKDANMVLADMLGVERRVLINRHFSRFVGSEFRSRWYTVLQALGETRCRQVRRRAGSRFPSGWKGSRSATTGTT